MNHTEFLKERLVGIFGSELVLVQIHLEVSDNTVYVKCEPAGLQLKEEFQGELGELLCDFEDRFQGLMLSFVREENLIQFSPQETYFVNAPVAVTYAAHDDLMFCSRIEQLMTGEDVISYRGINPVTPEGTLQFQQVVSVINGRIVVTTERKPFAGVNSAPVNSVQNVEFTYQTNVCTACIAA